MRILVATNHLFFFSGSEITAITIAEHLARQNHVVSLHARYRSTDFTKHLQGRGFTIVDELKDLPMDSFDAAYTQHYTSALAVRRHFPSIPILHGALGVLPDLEQPPACDLGISRYLALSEEVRDNLIAKGVPSEDISIFRNIVDSKKFTPAGPIADTPRTALVLSYKIDDARLSSIMQACAQLNIKVSRTPKQAGILSQERIAECINESDIVFSLGRGVIEAMMCGRIPFVFDYLGGDGLITPENVMTIAECNFSGRKFRRDYSTQDIIEEIKLYNPQYGPALRAIALREFDAEKAVDRLASMLLEARASAPQFFPDQSLSLEKVFGILSGIREMARLEQDVNLSEQKCTYEQQLSALSSALAKALKTARDQTKRLEYMKKRLAQKEKSGLQP